MASIRQLKKDVKSLCESVLNECYVELMFGTSNEIEFVWNLMQRCDKLQLETIHKINSKVSCKMNKKDRKKHYNALMNEFYGQTIELIKDLNSVIP